jgi:defect in organelle trafficking protein DotB
VLAATTGHGVMSTMHTVGVAETQRRAIMAIPADQRSAVAIDLMEMSTMYVTQLLVPGVTKPRVAVREYIKFDAATKRKIIAQPMERWTTVIQDLMRRGDVECQRMIDAAEKLHRAGEIDDHQLIYLSARQREAERVKPIAPEAPAVPLSLGGSMVPFSVDADENFDFSEAEVIKENA